MAHHPNCNHCNGGGCSCWAGNNPPPQIATLKFVCKVGALIRSTVKGQLLSAAYAYGLEIDIKDSGGWLDSVLYITIKGDAQKVASLQLELEKWKQLEA